MSYIFNSFLFCVHIFSPFWLFGTENLICACNLHISREHFYQHGLSSQVALKCKYQYQQIDQHKNISKITMINLKKKAKRMKETTLHVGKQNKIPGTF